MKVQKLLYLSALVMILCGPLFAQDELKIELIPFVGYTFSDGVPVNPIDVGDNHIVNALSPASSLSYGFEADLLIGKNFFAGFDFSQQASQLEGSFQGGGKRKFTDMAVRSYHGILGYNFGDADGSVRPYFFGGLGATNYSPEDIQGQSIDGATRFSTTWGGGVKFYFSENVGARFGGRWTPTHVNSEAGGIWCSPWWPWECWVLTNANYSNQFEMSAGLAFRF